MGWITKYSFANHNMQFREKNDIYEPKDFTYIIFDHDGGGDDCQAFVLIDYYVRKCGKILLGVICSNGNVNTSNSLNNCLIAQGICGSEYPLYVGSQESLNGKIGDDDYFGKDGIGNKQREYLSEVTVDPSKIVNQKAYRFIADSALKYANNIVYICTGPLTNLALAYHYNE